MHPTQGVPAGSSGTESVACSQRGESEWKHVFMIDADDAERATTAQMHHLVLPARQVWQRGTQSARDAGTGAVQLSDDWVPCPMDNLITQLGM